HDAKVLFQFGPIQSEEDQPREPVYCPLGMMSKSPRPATWALILAFALIYISWGTTYLAIQKGVRDEQLPPALFGGTRVGLAGVILLGFLAVRGQSLRLARRDLAVTLATSLLLFVCGN